MPGALARRNLNADKEWGWHAKRAFPASSLSQDSRSGVTRRHHVHESGLQEAVKEAARPHGFDGDRDGTGRDSETQQPARMHTGRRKQDGRRRDLRMEIYLVQHGKAMLKDVDRTRPLSDEGRKEVGQVAAFAARMGLVVSQIRHSGKTRAEQTAVILGEMLSPSGGVVSASGLAPSDDVQPVADALGGESQPVMLVGHLPFLARLTGLLLTGDAGNQVVRFRTGGIVCLAREQGCWQVAWILTPEMARVR